MYFLVTFTLDICHSKHSLHLFIQARIIDHMYYSFSIFNLWFICHLGRSNTQYVPLYWSTVNSKFTISKECKVIMDIDLIYEPCVIFQICLYTIHHFNFVHAAIKMLRYWYGSAELIETFLKNLEPYWGFLKLQGKIEAINS